MDADPLGAVPTAYADDPPADPAAAWVATSAGVFKIHGGDVPAAIGDLANVTSLSAAGTGASTTLVAVSDGQVQRWSTPRTGWTPTATLPDDAVAGEVVALDADSFLVGTDNGVARSDDGGRFVRARRRAGVVGAPARIGRRAISWLLADHTGVAAQHRRRRDVDLQCMAPGIATDADRARRTSPRSAWSPPAARLAARQLGSTA